MGAYLNYVFKFFVILEVVYCLAIKKGPLKPRLIREFCPGSDSSRTAWGLNSRLDFLRQQLDGCKRVNGNLELTHIRDFHLNGTDPEKALSFLNDIEEVTGYVLIFFNEGIRNLTLPRLRIIWGDTLHDNVAALHVSGNPKLHYLNLPMLRSIEKGSIVVEFNDYLCNWQRNGTVSYSEFFDSYRDSQSLVLIQSTNFKHCREVKDANKCHANCEGHCYGPEPDMCQTIYRGNCPGTCGSGMCFRSGNDVGCCDNACAAGCHGEGRNNCMACKKFEQDSKCVEKCNGVTDYDVKKMMIIKHKDPRYTYGRYCLKSCPPQMLVQEEHCVSYCKEGFWHDPEKNLHVCEPCPVTGCPKKCVMKEVIDAESIKNLKNCTVIDGFIKIPNYVFEDSKKYLTAEDNPSAIIAKKIPLLTEEMLEEYLSKVRVVTEYVEVTAGHNLYNSLEFLRNLEVIEGRALNDGIALLISHNFNLRYLGLKSLKKINAGKVYIYGNKLLCYVETLNITWNNIVVKENNSNEAVVKIENNRNSTACALRRRVCHNECQEGLGCWGPGDTMCVQCKNKRQFGHCVAECSINETYFDANDRECKKCHSECIQCTNGTSRDCVECKHVSHQLGTVKECLAKCPTSHFQNGSVCLPCSPLCHTFGCTGPGGYVGEGGCNKCLHSVEEDADTLQGNKRTLKAKITRCLLTPNSAKKVCAENNLTNYYAVVSRDTSLTEQFECMECSAECLTCTGYGNLVEQNGCECSRYISHSREQRGTNSIHSGDHCSMECEVGWYLIHERSDGKIGECGQCHELCDASHGCDGPTEHNCSQCALAGITNGTLTCINECPESRPFLGDDKICYSFDPHAALMRRNRLIVAFVALGVAIFIAVAAVLTWNCIKYKRRYKKEVELNLPALPECDPVDPDLKPNMNRLCLISTEQLSKTSQPLGRGAFGVVYAGYWWPKGKESSEKVAVAIKVVQDPSGTAQQEMLEEAGIMAKMRHEHLLRLVGVCLCDGIQLVTPLRPLGCLRDFLIKHHQALSARDLILYCYQIASAMEYLFKSRLVHRDLAARNVLVKRTNHVEVTDFGLAKMLEKGKSEITVGGKVAVKWLALESLQYRTYTHWTDVWAFGVTCWEVLTFGQTPYQGISPEKIRSHLESGNRLEQPNNCTQDVYQILLQCWLSNPESRPSFVILKEKFNQYCRAPHRYVIDWHHPLRLESVSDADQRDLINELLQDNVDFTDPLKYFDECEQNTTTFTTVTPTSPTWSGKPESTSGTRRSLASRRDGRFISTDSGRYQSDPVPGERTEIGMDEGNYLIPNTKEAPALLYTPVVVRENGETELMKSSEYYNDKIGNEYYNDVKSAESIKAPQKVASLENKEYFAESETAL